jgi:nucleoside-diphosphate-sugar epimerase
VHSVSQKKVLIAGASGLVGHAALREFEHDLDWEVVGVSRRKPLLSGRATHVSVDLLDRGRCTEVFGQMSDVTHVVYGAVNEDPTDLVAGWRDRDRMQMNQTMLENLFEPLLPVSTNLQHVSLMQGTKAYGGVAGIDVGFTYRERAPRVQHDNFYFLQEDYLRAKQSGKLWSWTVLRPVLILGDAVGSNLNILLVIGVYAALRKEAGLPLAYPGLPEPGPTELVDSDLLGRALKWAATASGARNEIFNVSNGDVVAMPDLYPAIAEEMGMEMGPPEASLFTTELPKQADAWAAIVRKYDLAAPEDLRAVVGGSMELADGARHPTRSDSRPRRLGGHSSTIRLRQAGFHDCMDSEDAVRKWFRRFHELRLLPPLE